MTFGRVEPEHSRSHAEPRWARRSFASTLRFPVTSKNDDCRTERLALPWANRLVRSGVRWVGGFAAATRQSGIRSLDRNSSMIRRDWLRFLVSLPFWRRSLPSVTVFQSNPGLANAAVEYRKAFQWIETLDQEQQQDFKRQFDLRRNDLPRMAELLRHAEPALARLLASRGRLAGMPLE